MPLLAHKLTLADGTVLDAGTIRQCFPDRAGQRPGGPGPRRRLCGLCRDRALGTGKRPAHCPGHPHDPDPHRHRHRRRNTGGNLPGREAGEGQRQRHPGHGLRPHDPAGPEPVLLAAGAAGELSHGTVGPDPGGLRTVRGLLADGTLDGLPNGAYPVRAFYADDLTGRQLIQWAAQAACRFARMTPAGTLEFCLVHGKRP